MCKESRRDRFIAITCIELPENPELVKETGLVCHAVDLKFPIAKILSIRNPLLLSSLKQDFLFVRFSIKVKMTLNGFIFTGNYSYFMWMIFKKILFRVFLHKQLICRFLGQSYDE